MIRALPPPAVLTALLLARAATAQTPATTDAPTPPAPTPSSTCVERLPEGKTRPVMHERFPARGSSGHGAVLEVEIEHGLGERVLPGALQIQKQDEVARSIEARGFVFPDASGPGRPRIRRTETPEGAKTLLQLTLLPLPSEPGRQRLELPPLPIAIARASGEVLTLCTQLHGIDVEDPTANEPNAKPKPNPEPLRQQEFWVAARNAVYAAAAALLVGALVFWLVRWWQRRPKQLPPPPPPRPPWEVALESFHEIRLARLIEQQQLEDHFDRVTHTLRRYLGDRFGFDGLESTTSEILGHLRESSEASHVLEEVSQFLEESDLVRFADVAPTEAQCHGILERSEHVVRRSMPLPAVTQPQASSDPGDPR